MITLSGPVQSAKQEKDMFVFQIAETSIAVLPRKKRLYELCSKIKSGVWVTVQAESFFTSSGDHIYDAKEIKFTEGINLTPKQ